MDQVIVMPLGSNVNPNFDYSVKPRDDSCVISFSEYHRLPTGTLITHYQIDKPSTFDLSMFGSNIQHEMFDMNFILDEFVCPFLLENQTERAAVIIHNSLLFSLSQHLTPMNLQCFSYGGTSETLYLAGMSQDQLNDAVYLSTVARSLAQWTEETYTMLSGPQLIEILRERGLFDQTRLKSKLN
jgi:hypothetical protein